MLCSKQFSPCKHTAKPIENLIHNLLHAGKVAIISVTTYIKHLDAIHMYHTYYYVCVTKTMLEDCTYIEDL